jgi:hypothetical protein
MNCRVCGRQFDPQGFQVMVPGIEHAFDRVDCALEASLIGLPPARSLEPAPVVRALPTPPPAVPVRALPAGPPPPRAESGRPQLFAGVNLALLAAGAAVTVYLWLRVFGADTGPITMPAESASAAFGRTTIAAAVDLSPTTAPKPQPESAVRGGGSQPATSAAPRAGQSGGGNATLVADRSSAKAGTQRQDGGTVSRPAPPPPPPAPAPEPPAQPGPTRSAPAPTYPIPSSPPADRVPGPALPGSGNPEQPGLPGGGTRG